MNPGWHLEIAVDGCESIAIHLVQLDAFFSEISENVRYVLSNQELDRAEKFTTAKLRQRYLAAQYFLRTVLARHTATSSQTIGFSFNKFGKPFLKNSPIFFNLTHSAEYAAVGITRDREIGIDIETGITPEAAREVAPGILAPGEREFWEQLDPEKKVSFFGRYWILKEAILKACGEGFSQNPREIEVLLGSSRPELKSLPCALGNKENWAIGTCRCSNDTPLIAWALRG